MPIFNVPGRGRVQLPEGLKQEDYQAILRGMQLEEIEAFKPEYTLGQTVGMGLQRGVGGLGISSLLEFPALALTGIEKLTGSEAAGRGAESLLGTAAEARQRLGELAPAQFESFEQPKGVGQTFRYGIEKLAEGIPSVGLAMTGGGLGLLLGRQAAQRAGAAALEGALAKGATREVAEAAGQKAAERLLQRRAFAGSAGTLYPAAAAEPFTGIYEQTGRREFVEPVLAGAASTMLESVVPGIILGNLGAFGKLKASERLLDRAGFKNAAADIALRTAGVGAAEGLTETAQQAITNLAIQTADNTFDAFGPERTKDYLEAFIGGTIVGGAFGGVGAAARRMRLPSETETKAVERLQELTKPPQEGGVITGGQLPPVPPGVAPSPPPPVTPPVTPPLALSVTPETPSAKPAPLSLPSVEPPVTPSAAIAPVEPIVSQEPSADLEPPKENFEVKGMETVEVPVQSLSLSKDVPQFKIGASAKGIVEPLGGKFERTGVAPIQVWRRLDGSLEIISGRHRFDLAQRSGESTIPAQIHDESKGFTKDHAAILDAELNIRDGQGKVKDYVNYFRESGIDKETAESRGLLARPMGKRAYTVATQGSDELIAAVRSDQIGDEPAYYIALNAPNDSRLQAVGINAINQNKSMGTAVNMMQAVKALASENNVNLDMFGYDDSAIQEAEEMAKIASQKQKELQTRLSAITGAAKNPQLAKSEGIDIRDPDAVKRRIEELRKLKLSWDNFSTDPQLIAEIREARGVPAPKIEVEEEELLGEPDLLDQRDQSMMRGSATQKKNAKEHADDVGGLVVYLDGDLSLIRGHSRLSGQPVYLAAKGDYRTNRDIESYTGNLLSDKEKDKLIAAKQSIEIKAEEQHVKSPFIKFDSQGVAVSQSVSPQLRGVLAGWKKLLKITPKIYITTISDVEANLDKFTGPHRAVGSAALRDEYGSVRKMADGEYYIAFTDSMSMSRMLETLAHELGHMHMRETFDNADIATQKSIRDEYDKWLKSNQGKSAREHIQSMRARGIGKLEKIGEKHKSEDLPAYWRSFNEWYADQVSRWATTSEKPLNVVERFFKRLADALRSFYAKLRNQKYLPNETFKQYMDEVTANIDYIAPIRVQAKPLGKTDQMALFMRANQLEPSDTEISYMKRASDELFDNEEEVKSQMAKAADLLDGSPKDADRGLQMMMSATPKFADGLASVRQAVGNFTTDNADMLLSFLNLRQLGKAAEKILPQMMQYYRKTSEMLTFRDNRLVRAAQLVERWDRWANANPDEGKALSTVLLKARLSGLRPTRDLDLAKIRDQEFLASWKKIKGTEGEQIFKEIDRFFRMSAQLYYNALRKRVGQAIENKQARRLAFDMIKVEYNKFLSHGFYFPFSRFGDYWVAYKHTNNVPAYYMFESQADQRNFIEKTVNPKLAAGEIKDFKSGVKTPQMISEGVAMSEFMTKLMGIIDEQQQANLFDDGGKNATAKQMIKDSIWQLYLTMGPDLSVQKHFIHAKKVEGYSVDALRAFSESAFHGTYHLARISFGGDLDRIVLDARNLGNAEPSNERGRYLRELQKHHEDFSSPRGGNQFVSELTNLGFMFYLSAPASAIVNLSQVPIVAAPYMAAFFNKSHLYAMRQVGAAAKEFMASRKGTAFDLPKYLLEQSKNKSLSDAQRNQYRDEYQAINRLLGTLNRTQTLSLAGIAERPSALFATGIKGAMRTKALTKYQKARIALGYMFNQAELFNRQVTALAAYRMAMESKNRNGEARYTTEQAVEVARDIVDETHFEYASETKARFMRGPVGQLVFQFMNYAQQMTALLITSLKHAVYMDKNELARLNAIANDKGKSEEERNAAKEAIQDMEDIKREARKRLSGILLMTMVFSGYEGLPFIPFVLSTVASAFLGDEDEPYNFKLEAKAGLAELFGDNAARILSRGLISEVTQMDWASRTGLDGLWFRDNVTSKDEAEWLRNQLVDALGPAVGMFVGVAEGIKKINDGYTMRGLETMMPPILKDGFKALRFATEGATTLRGDPIVADIGPYGIFIQLLGFTPQELARAQEARGEILSITQALDRRRSNIMNRLWIAHRNGDTEAYDDIAEEIIDFNSKNPDEEITEETVRRSFAQRQRISDRAVQGLSLPERRQYLLEKIEYAEVD